jgi:amidase
MNEHGAFVPGPRVRREPLHPGLLDGLSFAVKDLIDVAGARTTGGNPDWAASHEPPSHDAWAVHVLRRAGASMVGKTVTDELAFSLEGENEHHGTPVNPKAHDRLPGGSSSGSAVAVAAGLCDFALGTDTGGSVRIPASFCGLFAMRPTHGRISLQGVLPFAPSYDTVGWFARDAGVLARVGRVLLASPATQPEPRLAIATDLFALADPRVAARLWPLAEKLAPKARVVALGGSAPADWLRAYEVLQGAEIRQELGPWIATRGPRFGRNIAPRFEGLAALSGVEVGRWLAWRERQRERMRAELQGPIAWVLPTSPTTALRRDASGEERGRFYAQALALGSLAGHLGLPQVTLPVAELDGAPIGLSIVGARGADQALLDAIPGWLGKL